MIAPITFSKLNKKMVISNMVLLIIASHEIISGLRAMDFLEVKGEGYVPIYTRTDFLMLYMKYLVFAQIIRLLPQA
jgi:hypothetical protein